MIVSGRLLELPVQRLRRSAVSDQSRAAMSDILVFIICLLDGLLLMILSVYFVSFQTGYIAIASHPCAF